MTASRKHRCVTFVYPDFDSYRFLSEHIHITLSLTTEKIGSYHDRVQINHWVTLA